MLHTENGEFFVPPSHAFTNAARDIDM